MNIIRFIIGGIVIFIVFLALDFLIHSMLLGEVYASMAGIWRPDMMSKMWIMYAGSFIFSFLMMYVFIKGYEGRGIMEGVRFGIIIGIMTSGIGAFYQYATYPLPFSLVLQWFFYGLAEFIIAGICASLIYQPVEDLSDDYS
ncbi:MAG TPA: hypothetical protein PK358_05485 [Spirochaetota bacterium]|nr:hypothetical protein [Spirochaetota bacterium]HPJ34268.1 hypothetical protein [Spirochaetota bacterium]